MTWMFQAMVLLIIIRWGFEPYVVLEHGRVPEFHCTVALQDFFTQRSHNFSNTEEILEFLLSDPEILGSCTDIIASKAIPKPWHETTMWKIAMPIIVLTALWVVKTDYFDIHGMTNFSWGDY